MLQHFIVPYSDGTAGTPHKWELGFIDMAIQHDSTKADIG